MKNTMNIMNANITILSFLDDESINEHYILNIINGCNFLKVKNIDDIKKHFKSDMIFILTDSEIDDKYLPVLNKMGETWTVKILVSNNKLNKLNKLCHSQIKPNLDHLSTHVFMKKLIESIVLPGLTGLDYADVKEFLSSNKNIKFITYVDDYKNKGRVIEKIENTVLNKKDCFFILTGSSNLTLDDVVFFQDNLSPLFNNVLAAARVIPEMTNSFELFLFTSN
jgi:hypothetical protein